MTLPIITDPFFYAVAIPAVLLLGVSKSGFGAGFGSLAVPLMAMAITVPQAAAVLMPVLLLMDLLGIAVFRKDFDRQLLKFLIPYALVGTLIGAVMFKLLDAKVVAGMVGAFTLLFLAQRLLFPPKPDSPPLPKWLGALLTITSGFTSFIAHAGGPPISAYVIPLRLSPIKYTATLAFFVFRHQFVEVDPVCLAGLAGHAQHGHVAGAAAAGTHRRVGWRAHCAACQPHVVLQVTLRRHVFNRLQIALGRICLNCCLKVWCSALLY